MPVVDLDTARAGAHEGEPLLVRVDAEAAATADPAAQAYLQHAPALTLAVGHVPAPLRDLFDLVVDDALVADSVTASFERAPRAAIAAALLVRNPSPDVWAGLVAESATYSLLQAGPEFADWLAGRAPAQPPDDDSPRVRVGGDDDLTEIVLTRPARHNALDPQLRDELFAALLGEYGSTGPIVVRAEGPSFCSGGDLDTFGTFPDPVTSHLIRLSRSLARAFHELADRLVVGIHGACLGAGIELPAFASHVVAADDARIGLPELDLGLVPGAGGTVSITHRVGGRRMLELLLLDGTITAADALEWGLVDEVVPRDALGARLVEIAGAMA